MAACKRGRESRVPAIEIQSRIDLRDRARVAREREDGRTRAAQQRVGCAGIAQCIDRARHLRCRSGDDLVKIVSERARDFGTAVMQSITDQRPER